jgi:ribonuclease E
MKECDLMVDDSTTPATSATQKRTRRRAASRPAGPPVVVPEAQPTQQPVAPAEPASAEQVPAERTRPTRKSTKRTPAPTAASDGTAESAPTEAAEPKTAKKSTRKSSKKAAPAADDTAIVAGDDVPAESAAKKTAKRSRRGQPVEQTEETTSAPTRMVAPAFVAPLFQPPATVTHDAPEDSDGPVAKAPAKRTRRKTTAAPIEEPEETVAPEGDSGGAPEGDEDEGGDEGSRRKRRRRGGRGRKRRVGEDDEATNEPDGESDGASESGPADADEDEDGDAATRRRWRRRRRGADGDVETSPDDPPNTVVRVRQPRTRGGSGGGGDDVTSVKGSTRLEAKKQRRREGREAGRRRAPILTESEFLARREAVNRVMVVRQKGERTQIAVLEDGVLVEHYVTRGSSSSMVGNVYLGRVQNVLPSMEAAFVDIGRGRNAVLYAGEVNWDAAGMEGQPKRIEFALKSGDPVLVQVTKDPVGQKGARLTSQISLPGRYLVYVPDGSMTGISRKLPDTERSRLKGILKRVMPEDAGVIVRTAAEGAPEEALEQDVLRLTAQWTDISKATKSANPPTLLYSEPDLAIKVVRDIFNEDVHQLVIAGEGAWTAIGSYIGAVAPDLAPRLDHFVGNSDVFAEYRVEEQLMKALDRKVYLPSGGSLVIDRTEAMTVVDVNTGKFTGQGGNLEQTVTRNNIEAAEEIVRQLRLRDIGGIIVVDFIDMVLESNRDLVLRRLVECLGRDRTKHQVAEVTSLGLVQMTRKRIGSGLLESFSESCEHCNGRGIRVSLHGDHDHSEGSPKYRRPANAVDPADVAARALAAHELHEEVAEEIGSDESLMAVADPTEVDAFGGDVDEVFADVDTDVADVTPAEDSAGDAEIDVAVDEESSAVAATDS